MLLVLTAVANKGGEVDRAAQSISSIIDVEKLKITRRLSNQWLLGHRHWEVDTSFHIFSSLPMCQEPALHSLLMFMMLKVTVNIVSTPNTKELRLVILCHIMCNASRENWSVHNLIQLRITLCSYSLQKLDDFSFKASSLVEYLLQIALEGSASCPIVGEVYRWISSTTTRTSWINFKRFTALKGKPTRSRWDCWR